MNWKSTWTLMGVALALFAFIYFVERHTLGTADRNKPPGRLLDFQVADVTSLQLRRTNQFILKVERTNDTWNITSPISYPAQPLRVENLVALLAELRPENVISIKDMAAQKQSIADFGLDVPSATVVLGFNGRRLEIMFGSRTSIGDRVYVQLMNSPNIYVVNVDAYDKLPPTPHPWRDIMLVSRGGLSSDRIEVRAPGKTYAVQINPTNFSYMLTKPTPARADRAKVEALLRSVDYEPVRAFVTDDPHADLEHYGFQPPIAELVFGQGTNDQLVVQFGKTTNDFVYARRMANTNVVLVAKSFVDELLKSPSELRDFHLLAFSPSQVDTIEVDGREKFTVHRHGTNSWQIPGPQPLTADPDLMREWLNQLASLEGTVEKDVVTDFSAYGLSPASRQYLLKFSYTNSAGLVTNRLVGSLALSPAQGEKVFARGAEDSVYSLKLGDVNGLPSAPWQLRDRRVWSFSTNLVASVTIHDQGYTRRLLRKPGGEWSLDKGSTGIINTFLAEETAYQLGQLKAAVWVEKTDANRALYGFKESGYKLSIELKNGDKAEMLTIEFGERAPSGFPYAIANVDGQNMIFEFPLQLFLQVAGAFRNPPMRAATPR